MGATTAVSTPQDQVEALMKQTAEEANIELQHDLEGPSVQRLPEVAQKETIGEEDSKLAERLRALRPV